MHLCLQTEFFDLLNLSSTCSRLANLLRDEAFWKMKTQLDFPDEEIYKTLLDRARLDSGVTDITTWKNYYWEVASRPLTTLPIKYLIKSTPLTEVVIDLTIPETQTLELVKQTIRDHNQELSSYNISTDMSYTHIPNKDEDSYYSLKIVKCISVNIFKHERNYYGYGWNQEDAFILMPRWNVMNVQQVVGRAYRHTSHWNMDFDGDEMNIDVAMYQLSETKQLLQQKLRNEISTINTTMTQLYRKVRNHLNNSNLKSITYGDTDIVKIPKNMFDRYYNPMPKHQRRPKKNQRLLKR